MNRKNLDDCPDYLRDFLFYMGTVKERSERTVDGYYYDLRTFLRFLKEKEGLVPATVIDKDIPIADTPLSLVENLKLTDANEFLYMCKTERDNEASARSRKISALRSFYKYLTVSSNRIANNPIEHLEVPSIKRSLPKYLTLEQAINLLKNVDTAFPERDFCMLTLFLNCGMRLAELVGIDLGDIKRGSANGEGDGDRLRLLGKGNKERIVYLNRSCIDAIDAYLEALEGSKKYKRLDKKALFLNSRGQRIGARRVEQIVEDCLSKAGLSGQGYSPHKLRHTAATLLYQHGNVDIRVLQELLGHVSLATTEIYTHVSNKQLQDASNKSPMASIKPPKKKKPKPENEE